MSIGSDQRRPAPHRLITALVAALLLVLSLGYSGGSATLAWAASGTLTLGVSAPLNSLTPVGLQQTDMTYNRAIYNTLVDVKGGANLVPDLATSWSVGSTGTTITFNLRSGVDFQNGTPFTADSVVAMLKWAQNPANSMDATTVLKGMTFSASSPTTVVVNMPGKEADQLLPTLVTLPIADLSSDLATHPIGTGPFKVSSFTPNVSLTLTRWDGYWNKAALPKVSTLKYTVFEDQASEQAALEAHAIDILTYPPLNQVSRLKSNGFHVLSSPGTGNFYFFGNVETSGPWSKQKVRQAFSYAFNRPLFTKLELGGRGEPTCDMWAKTSPAYVQNIQGCGYSLKKAKELLKEAGYAHGLKMTFYTTGVRIPEITSFLPIYKTDLSKIGVTLDIKNVSPNTWANNFTAIKSKQIDGVQDNFYGWANDDAYFAADYAVYGLDNNLSNYSSSKYDQMIKTALTQSGSQAVQTYKKLAVLAAQEAFSIVVATRPYVYVYSSNVHNMKIDDDGQAIWNSVTLAT